MALSPASRLGPYEILDLLGRGGMGEVYRARDPRLGREVAIKVLPEALAGDPERLRRFETEARATGGLNHPNILTVHDIGTEEDRPYLVAELLEGETLQKKLAAGPLSPKTAVEVALHVARGLAAAHGRGVIHRDLKPGNLFLTRDGTVKILDFGLAKLSSPSLSFDSLAATSPLPTATGVVLGTLGYLSPEQARGEAVDERSDLFSLGAVLYEMLSGRRAFAAATPIEALAAVLNEDSPPLPELGIEVPASLEALIRRCLAKAAGDRIGSARELETALGECAEELEPPPARASRGPIRKPLLGAALVAIALVAGLLWVLLQQDGPETPAGGTGRIESLAVLPLENLSGDPGEEVFADGMTDALIAELGRLDAFRVISRTSVMHYKKTTKRLPEIAAELDVDAVVEGSVLRAGDRVRITTRLVEAASDRPLWTESFERNPEDVLALQREVAEEMVRGIGAQMGAPKTPERKPRRVDPKAYDAFLTAQVARMRHVDPQEVIAAHERAIELDPSFAPAYASLANYLGYLALIDAAPAGEAYLRSRELARRAIELDPDLPEARVALGRVHFQFEWDWSAAEEELDKALEMDPGNATALGLYGAYRVLIRVDCEGGLDLLEEARNQDPLNPGSHFNLGVYSLYCGRWDASIRHMTRAAEMSPGRQRPRLVIAWAYWMKGAEDQAIELCDEVIAGLGERFDAMALASCSLVHGEAGHAEAARRLLDRLRHPPGDRPVDPFFESFACLAIDDVRCSLDRLEEAFRQRSPNLVFLRLAPAFDRLRDDPRFESIMQRMRFPS